MGGITAQPIDASAFGFTPRAGAFESWTSTAADVEAWLKNARQGDRFIYAHGPSLIHGAAAALVSKLKDAGEVIPHHKRAADGAFDFVITRRLVRVSKAMHPDLPKVDMAMLAVLTALQAAAYAKRRCPSDAGLAAITGLPVADVKWQMRKLRRDHLIEVWTVATSCEPRFRIVKVVATGMETAGPGGTRDG